ncbi:hypothetical protein BDY21DRAFT_356523 [Lineolata rhizophorae]|uniref:Uncharacterized protein n=1 Tax=Lineolata rhizophorae TaxID=578093 RepID=A0A6A6NPE0_9PEZI|nr:hypothetical protein BDY21DRAFT_356523 [Lineolata rhizophorae]
MPLKQQKPSEADIVFNRASVTLARSKRLVASWLPPPTEDELNEAQKTDGMEAEESELLKGGELLGVGAKPPQSDEKFEGMTKHVGQLSANERLRRQLIGKNAKPLPRPTLQKSVSTSTPKPTLEKPGSRKLAAEDEYSEDEGRVATFKSKRIRNMPQRRKPRDDDMNPSGEPDATHKEVRSAVGHDDGTSSEGSRQGPGNRPGVDIDVGATVQGTASRRRPMTFLDEILVENEKKRRKKKRKKGKPNGSDE